MTQPKIRVLLPLSCLVMLASCIAMDAPTGTDYAPTIAHTDGTGGTTGGSAAGGTTPSSGSTGVMPPGSTARVAGNPFGGTVMYVNPDYEKFTDTSAAAVTPGSADAALVAKARQIPTAVWLDSTAAIVGGTANSGRLSLAAHLDQAVQEAITANKQMIVPLVLYNLPNRDCAAKASAGLLSGDSGLAQYKSDYIDVIYKSLSNKPAYQYLRFALVVEPDSLPNMVTNASIPACAAVASAGYYTQGIAYAIQKLGALPNVYFYLDIAHSGWLGWPANLSAAVTYYVNFLQSVGNGNPEIIRGLATNIANYTPVQEPFVSSSNATLLSGPFYEGNPEFDEVSYIQALDTQFRAAGFTNLGYIMDTSRNGWPLVNDGNPIDRRHLRGNWCNINGAGMGPRPQTAPAAYAGLDAYVFVKPPGESDGTSLSTAARFDPTCDPNAANSDALPNAPEASLWFHAEFMGLLRNATPAF